MEGIKANKCQSVTKKLIYFSIEVDGELGYICYLLVKIGHNV